MTTSTRKKTLTYALGALVFAATATQAAIMETNPVVQIGNSSAHYISVYPGKAAYDGGSYPSGVFGDGTVLDYRFFNNVTIASGGYAYGGGGRVSDITTGGGLTDYNMDYADVWTLTDPGTLDGNGIPAFSSSADFGGTYKTMSGQQIVDGTIDISNLVTGSVYVLCGHYDNPFTVTLTMSGSGQPDIQRIVTVDPPGSRNKYIVSVEFEDAGNDYDAIAFNYTGGAGNRSRFMGVILDGAAAAGEIVWSGTQTTLITISNATASAAHTEDLDNHFLVWDTSDKGTLDVGDWTYSTSLGPDLAGPTSGQLTGLSADTYYTWRFFGSNAASQAWSPETTFPTPITDAQAPVFTNASVVTDTLDASLGWIDNTSTETGFILLRSDDGISYTVIDDTIAPDTTSYIDTVPMPGTYYYRLAATNSFYDSGTDPAVCEDSVAFPIPAIYIAEVVLVDEGDNTGHPISVYPGKARYEGNRSSGVFGDGTVIDYRFFNTPMTNEGYAVGTGGLLSGITYSGQYNFGLDSPNVWTTNDPDSEPANYTTQTKSGFENVAGTIDVSGLYGGEVYILCGGYSRDMTVTLTMTGPGQGSKEASLVQLANSSRNTYFFRGVFGNELLAYDTISYTYNGSGKSCFMGVIVDGEEPPSGTLLRLR